jgi:hypothetical protein
MEQLQTPVFCILFNGSPVLVSPVGAKPTFTYMVDLEDVFLVIQRHSGEHGAAYWTEFGKGKTILSAALGSAIEEKSTNSQVT